MALVKVGGRPRPVVVAVALMSVTGVAYLVDAGAVLAGAAEYPRWIRSALESSSVDPQVLEFLEPLAATLAFVVAIAITVAAVLLIGSAASVWAGHRAGRIVAWVVIGLVLAGTLAGLTQSGTPGLSGIARVTAFSRDAGGTHTFAQALPESYPASYRQLSTVVAMVAFLGLALAAVLLARPSASVHFAPRRPPPPARTPRPPGGTGQPPPLYAWMPAPSASPPQGGSLPEGGPPPQG
jgi:hypothetical protein